MDAGEVALDWAGAPQVQEVAVEAAKATEATDDAKETEPEVAA